MHQYKKPERNYPLLSLHVCLMGAVVALTLYMLWDIFYSIPEPVVVDTWIGTLENQKRTCKHVLKVNDETMKFEELPCSDFNTEQLNSWEHTWRGERIDP